MARKRRNGPGAAKAKTTKNYLCTLPKEIRHMILLEALPIDTVIRVGNLNWYGRREEYEKQSGLALSRTCRQLYTEVLPIYYSRNTLNLSHIGAYVLAVGRFLEAIGQDRRSLIKSILFYNVGTAFQMTTAAQLMYQCLHLERLAISILHDPPDGNRESLEEFVQAENISTLEGLRGLREVKVSSRAGDPIAQPLRKNLDMIQGILMESVVKEKQPGDRFSLEMLSQGRRIRYSRS